MQAQQVSPVEPTGPDDSTNLADHLQSWAQANASPLLLISADLTVIWCNPAAQAFRDRWPAVGVDAGRLFLAERNRTTAFREFLSAERDAPGAWVFEIAETRFILRAEPVPSDDDGPVFFVKIQEMDSIERYVWADVAAAFGLTMSENRVVKLLISGLPVEALARELSISVETVRTHVRRVYAKMGVRGREQMFSAVLPYRLG